MKNLLFPFLAFLFLTACNVNTDKLEKAWHKDVKRVGMVVKLKPEMIGEYKKVHADENQGVRHLLEKYNMRNFSIFLVQLADSAWYEFAYYEYWGNDLEGDMAKLDAEPENIKWLEKTDAMQEGILPGQQGWKVMERIYYNY